MSRQRNIPPVPLRHIERKRKIPLYLYVILSASEISTLCLYVILSVSEISHNLSERYMSRQFFGGILHFVQNDV